MLRPPKFYERGGVRRTPYSFGEVALSAVAVVLRYLPANIRRRYLCMVKLVSVIIFSGNLNDNESKICHIHLFHQPVTELTLSPSCVTINF